VKTRILHPGSSAVLEEPKLRVQKRGFEGLLSDGVANRKITVSGMGKVSSPSGVL
jgi:hypothetical protein